MSLPVCPSDFIRVAVAMCSASATLRGRPPGKIVAFTVSLRCVLFLLESGAFALAYFRSVVEAPGPHFGVLAAADTFAVPAAFVAAPTRHGVPSRWWRFQLLPTPLG